MRSTNTWRSALAKQLRPYWPQGAGFPCGTFCEIELGLFASERLLPQEPARNLWMLLTGYPYRSLEHLGWTAEQQRAARIVRYLLPYYRGRFPWQRALRQYRAIDSRLRGYDIDEDLDRITRRSPSLGADRWRTYERALAAPPPYRKTTIRWAGPGGYTFADGRRQAAVTIPADLPLPGPPNKHQPIAVATRQPILVTLEDLRQTAAWMDAKLGDGGGHWQARIARVRLELFNQAGTALEPAQQLTIDGMAHIVGMVSAGKSTLMDILAVFAAKHGYHTTLVVGDVMSVLQRADLFKKLEIKAAPILGSSNRARHLSRLHRAQAANHGPAAHHGFAWLSTACALDGLRETSQPLAGDRRPCLGLTPDRTAGEDSGDQPLACPFFSGCAYHQAQRDLIDAAIWLATPASLIYTRVAPQIMGEQVRFAELVSQRSDLVVIDEADRVQIQLDNIFSPAQNLVSRAEDAWLSRLDQQVTQQISREGRGQLSDPQVAAWCQAHDLVQIAASRVYALLLQSDPLKKTVEKDYFTAWMLLERLAQNLSDLHAAGPERDAAQRRLMEIFERCVDDPLGEQSEHGLTELVRRCLTLSNPERTKADVKDWLAKQSPLVVNHPQQHAKLAEIMEFALNVAVLSNRLDVVIREWHHVEGPLQLEGAGSALFHRPPDDYIAEIPAAPMGNVLAFQYLRNSHAPEGPGTLRFFRCMGIGRWILLHFNTCFGFNQRAGPHVLLLSATSWAGNAPGFDIQLPVQGILSAPDDEIAAIQRSRFEYRPVLDHNGVGIRISGLQGHERTQAIESMVSRLARRSGLGGASQLERVRDQLPAGRQRILLLVGSYEEALNTSVFLTQTRSDWAGQVVHLVADDDTLESDWRGAQGLQRGMVHRFAETAAWILVAPLLAIERGHNILNQAQQAAIGAAFFLLRPHPRPDDISFAISSINRWAIETIGDRSAAPAPSLEQEALQFRSRAYQEWRRLLHLPMIYSTLPANEHQAVTWSQLVTMWQVIGRLVRGGVEARIFFCDTAFATLANDQAPGGQRSTSLLLSMIDLLRPYFTASERPARDKALAQRLYGPLYQALIDMGGI